LKYRAEKKCSALHRDQRCPLFRTLLGVSRHRDCVAKCLLLTQSGHQLT
jgi:hypothetical protein